MGTQSCGPRLVGEARLPKKCSFLLESWSLVFILIYEEKKQLTNRFTERFIAPKTGAINRR